MKQITLLLMVLISISRMHAQTLSNTLLGYQESFTQIISQSTDAQGNIYYAGNFKGDCIINNQSVFTGSGGNDVFLVKTDSSGTVIWAKKIGDVGNESITAMLFHKGVVYMTITLSQSSVLDGTAVTAYGNNRLTTAIAKIDTAGGSVMRIRKTTMPVSSIMASDNVIYLRGQLQSTFGDLTYEETDLLPYVATFRNILMYVSTDVDYLGHKIMAASNSAVTNTQSAVVLTPFVTAGNRLFFMVYSSASGASAVQIGTTSVAVSGTSNQAFLVKTDSSFATIQVKRINPNNENYISNLFTESSGFSVNREQDSIYMILAGSSNTGSYTLDGFNEAIGDQNVLVVMDTGFVTRRVKPLGLHRLDNIPLRLTYSRLTVDGNHYYFRGRYTGTNNAAAVSGISPNNAQIALLYGLNETVDLNGVSGSFIVKTDRGFTSLRHRWLGMHTLYETTSVQADFQTIRNNRVYFLHAIDNVWNPWIVDSSLTIVRGAMKSNADRPENTNYVKYFTDGGLLIVGQARGKTALDASSNGIISTQTKSDLFFVVLNPNNSVKWYKRMFSSFGNISISKVITRNDKLYMTLNFNFPLNNGSNNYIRIENQVFFITPQQPQTSLMLTADRFGNFKLLQFPAPFNIVTTFDVFSDGDVLLLSRLSTVALSMPGRTFSTANGYYAARFDTLGVVKDAVKFSAAAGSQGSVPTDIVLDTATGNFTLLTFQNFAAGVSGATYDFSNGSTLQLSYTVPNPRPALTSNKSYYLFKSANFTAYRGSGTYGPANARWGGSALLNGRTVFILGKSGAKDSIYFNSTLIIPDSNSNVSSFIALDRNAGYVRHKIVNSGNTFFPVFNLGSMNVYKNQLYVSGSLMSPRMIDTIQVQHAGSSDAITVQFDTTLTAKRVFRLSSIYSENMMGSDIYNDTLMSFAYIAQGTPVLTNNRTQAAPGDLEENAYVQTVLLQAGVATSVSNPELIRKLKVFPNPVSDKLVYIDLSGETSGVYTWMLYNTEGKLITQSQFQWLQGAPQQIQLPATLSKGSYVLTVQTKSNRLNAVKLLIQ